MGRLGPAAVTVAALAAVAGVVIWRAGEVGEALRVVPLAAVLGAIALHAVTLLLRSEGWRVAIAAIDGRPLDREAVHGANAGAFGAGTVQSHFALPVRVALLRRWRGDAAPRPMQLALADLPIALAEACCVVLLLALWKPWLAVPGVVVLLALGPVARASCARWDHSRPTVRGVAVLADGRRRTVLLALAAAITLVSAARVWLVLAACGVPADAPDVALVVGTLGVLGLLPLGPAASPGATLATLAADGVGSAMAAGLVISASSIGAVVLYALLVAGALGGRRLATWSPAGVPAPEGAEA
ncbi:hypothetical protein LRS13_25255 [Svornostia abyssi]|uniref:Uncharacterized protein n=1 Tax=Svornostia abyssi TaxID=2898438 RepID=A0ABY5PH52_9ACTN|nr:hypothetical protein LRS13_25255 [Parviterribacteraceae bacterium J379]